MIARENPFAVSRLHALAFRGHDIASLFTQALAMKRAALVGPEGFGKTTLMHELAAHAHALGHRTTWVQLRRDARRLSSEQRADIRRAEIVFVDGADLLTMWDRVWLRRHARDVVIGTLHRPGWLPALVTLETSAELLGELVGELGERIERGDCRELFARHRGNLRLALRELYDRAATSR